ncbi:hypothetical protein ACO3VM_02730 [Methanocaldococcus sp. 10A]
MYNLNNFSTQKGSTELKNFSSNSTSFFSPYNLSNFSKSEILSQDSQNNNLSGDISEFNIYYDEEQRKVIAEIVFTDGTKTTKSYDISNLLQNAYNNGYNTGYNDGYNKGHSEGYNTGYNDGVNSVDFKSSSAILDNFTIKTTVTLTNNKSKTFTYTLTETEIINMYNKITQPDSGLHIKMGNTEYVFPVIDSEPHSDINAVYHPAIDGHIEYALLGNPVRKWSFEIYVNSLQKLQFLEQLTVNPICLVKFDEIGDYKQCIIRSLTYSKITEGRYRVSLDLVIL